MLAGIEVLWNYYVARLRTAHDEAGGVTTETAIITAILAGLALTVGAIIVAKVTATAQGIPTE